MKKILTICVCSSRNFIDKKKVAQLAATAEVAGWDVSLVADLCELAQSRSAKMADIAAADVLAGCHERAMKALLSYCDLSAHTLLNIRKGEPAEWLSALDIDASALPADDIARAEARYHAEVDAMPVKSGDDAWNPVLDKDLCVECGKCHDFCPFGVYEMVDDRVRVVHPTHCKNNCPACARNCPAGAIIFPKYDHSPINGGEDMEEKAVKLDSRDLYAQNLREKLEARRKAGLSFLKK